jgi:aminoglycoside phosphotransferase (APT) family kinase protein
MDVQADDFLLLLEDLTDVHVGDEVAGCTAAEAELVIRHIAEFHARWWESPLLEKLDWMPDVNAPVQKSAVPAYEQTWEPFLANFGAALSPAMHDLCARMKDHVGTLLDQLAPAPRTILHGDWRLDNIFFGDGTIAAIDWQISTKGRGAFDVGYFLSSCIEADVRRAEEERLVRLWWEIASDGGKGGYSFDDAWTDYRRSVLFSNAYTVIGIGSLDAANERGMALFQAWLRRRSAAIEELKAGDLLPG